MTSCPDAAKLKDPSLVFSQTNFPKSHDDFHWVETDEPHASRRKLILKAHPEMKELFVKEPLTFVIVVGIVAVQTALAAYLSDKPLWLMVPVAWVFGGAMNHTLQLAGHELSHNLCWDNLVANQLTAILANLPTGIPSAIMFAKYHMDHHQFQGEDSIDTDMPSLFEVHYFSSGPLAKTVWMLLNPFWYAIRPLIIKPKKLCVMSILNSLVCVAWDVFIVSMWGWQALAYMIASSLLGLGLHPVAGHFIAEHYEFVMGYETYSYYGSLNWINFNVGYHNEHHDFPRIPWSKLPLVRKIAPEFYDNLPFHTSYVKVLLTYIFDPHIGPYSRIRRKNRTERRANGATNGSTIPRRSKKAD